MSEPTARRSAPDAPSVAVEPGTHTIPGGAATLRVHVRNVAAEARHLRLSVIGLEEGWRPAVLETPDVAPDETVTIETVITPTAGAASGDYSFLVVVESSAGPAGPASRTVADASVRVDAASDVVLAVEPADLRGLRRKKVDVVIGNSRAGLTDVVLDSSSDSGLKIRLDADRVELGPAETLRVPATVRAPLRLAGGRVRHSYQVVATGRAAPQRVQGTFTSHALLGTGMLRVTAIVAVMALWVTAVVIALPRLADRMRADEEPTTAEAGATSPGATSPGDAESGAEQDGGADAQGGAGQGGAGGADGEDGDADAAADGVRVSGVISGADPGDVVIDVVPTASLRPSDVEARQPGAAPGKIAAAAMPLERSDVAQRMSTRTNSSGVWALSGLSGSTRYLVTISKPGFGTQRIVMTGNELAANPLETDLQAGEGSMSGVVMGPGGPVGGVELTLSDGTTTVTTRSATTGQVGRWRVDGLTTPSTYLVSASAADLGTESQLVTLAAAGSREVMLTLEAGVASISGRVVGTDSLGGVGGLGGITVSATDGTTTRTATTVTGSDAGRFLLSGLPVPSHYTVTISGIGYSTVTREVTLTAAGVSGWTISLTSSGGVVTGTVRDETGAGITAAGLVLTSGTDAANVYKTMSASDGSGTFRFSGVTPGTYVLSAEAFGHTSSYAEVVVTAGARSEVDLTLRRIPGDGLVATSSITGRVFDASTSGQITCPVLAEGQDCVVTASVAIEDVDGTHRTISSTAAPGEPYRLPAPGGDEEGLLPGRYIVTLTAPGYEPGHVTVTVPMAAEAQAAPVALEPSPSLIGTVLPRTGVLPDGVCIVARQEGQAGTIDDPCGQDEPECATATSRCALVEDGTYRMDRLSAGNYEVTVANLGDSGYVTPAPQPVSLLPGEVKRYDILLERNGIISVSMLASDSGGIIESAPGTWVRLEGTDIEDQADDNGFAQLTNIPPGTYRVIGSREQDGQEISSTSLQIGLNQEISIQLVLADGVDSVVAGVRYETSAATQAPIAGATIAISGVIGYLGTVPQPGHAVFTTGATGTVQICTQPADGCQNVIPLVRDTVTITVTANGFVQFQASNVPLSSLSGIVMVPEARDFSGSITVEGNDQADPDIHFEVLVAPPGVVGATATAPDSGPVTFYDPSIGQQNRIRPGHYEIQAWADGFASDTARFDVPLSTSSDPFVPPTWTLLQDSRVAITPVVAGTSTRVPGAVMTLTTPDERVIERTAGPNQQVLDFGTLPAGEGYTLTVGIAGYERRENLALVVPAGGVLSAPMEVEVVRLGTIRGDVVTVLGNGWTQNLPGATVTAERQDGEGPDFTGTTGADGTYSITGTVEISGLTDGDWTVTASAANHLSIPVDGDDDRQPDSSADVGVPPGQTVAADRLGLAPRPSQLVVTVVDGGDPVPGLDLQLVYSDPSRTPSVEPCTEDVGETTCRTGGGDYHFLGLLPLTYTLFVSGGGYPTLGTSVTIAPGEVQLFTVPLSAPAGSIQGQVLRTLADGSTTPLLDADADLVQVALLQDGAEVQATSIEADGDYLLQEVPGGTFTLAVQQRADEDAAWVSIASRSIVVMPGQSSVLDLVIPLVSRTVTVTATPSSGADLVGGLVTLTATIDGEDVTLGPQPLGRSGGAFVTTFTQVPLGTWVAVLSGPAGHHGSHASDAAVVGAGTTPVPIEIDVAETELRLQVAPVAGPLTPPGQVTVTATPSDDDSDVDPVRATLIPGAGDTVLYVPAIGWALSAANPAGGWEATIVPATIGSGTARVLARVTLTPPEIDTTTTVTIDPDDSADVGTSLTVTADVSVSGSAPDPIGEVTFSYRLEGEDTWTAAGTAELASGEAEVTVPTTALDPGSYTFRATFDPSEQWWGESSDTATITLTEPDAGGEGAEAGTDGQAPVVAPTTEPATDPTGEPTTSGSG